MYFQRTPIYASVKQLYRLIITKQLKMKGEWNRTVGYDIRQMLYEIFRDIQYANRQSDRLAKIHWLEKFQADYSVLEVQIDILYNERVWNDETRAEISDIMLSIGKQLTGWRNKT